MKKITLVTFFIFFILLISCTNDDNENAPASKSAASYTADVPVSWYELQLTLIKETKGYTPPIAARSIGYTGVALYEAAVGGRDGHHSLNGQLSGLNGVPKPQSDLEYNWAISANAALAEIMRNLFATASDVNLEAINSLEATNLDDLSSDSDPQVISRSVAYGKEIADFIFEWSKTDGGNQAYLNPFPSDYSPPVGDQYWVPTPSLFQSAMLPKWGDNRLMAPANVSELNNMQDPPAFATDHQSAFFQAANEVYTTGKSLTSAQTTIAQYWADGAGTFSPPGHLIGITAQLIKEKQFNLAEAAVTFAKVGIALNDAGTVCWKWKYTYNVIRPITYIQRYIDPNWNSLIATPPFPSYVSGHSTFSAATAGVLTSVFGENFHFTDRQKLSYGFESRSFTSFNAAADEAAISRLYGGIHYTFDNEAGKTCGKRIAANVAKIHL